MKKSLFFILIMFVLFSPLLFSAEMPSSEEYLISNGDVLEIFNYGYPDLSHEVTVGPDGNISVKLVGNIKAAGKTSKELAGVLKSAFYEYAPESRISVIIKKYYPKIILISGEVKSPSQIDTVMDGEVTLLEAISICGGPSNDADLSNVVVINKDGKGVNYDISSVYEFGISDRRIILNPGDTVVVPRKYEKRVYVYGDISKSGVVYFERKEPMNINSLLSKLGYDLSSLSEEISIFRNGNTSKVNISRQASLNDSFTLQSNDIVVVKSKSREFVYVTGIYDKTDRSGIVEFDTQENFTVKSLLGKIGIDPEFVESISVESSGGVKKEYDAGHFKFYDEPLSTGDFVKLPREKYVYVIGNSKVSGKVDFNYYETLSLKTLISKIGYDLNFKSEIKVTSGDGTVFKYGSEDVKGSEVYLPSGSIVEIPPQRYVYALGEIQNPENPVLFSDGENMNLKTLIAKVNGISEKYARKIRILRDGSEFEFDSKTALLSETEFALQTGDIVYFENDRSRYVYAITESEKTVKVEFEQNEDMNLFELLIKIGEIPNTVDRSIKIFKSTGNVITADLDSVLSMSSHVSLDTGSVVVLPKTERSVYVLGEVKTGGKIYFERDEEFSLDVLIAKTGADISGNIQSVIIKSGSFTKEMPAEDISKLDYRLTLNPGDIVYFKPFSEPVLNIFGMVKDPGAKTFSKNENITLMSLIAKSGGFLEGSDGNLKIIKSNGYIDNINYDDLDNPNTYELSNGDTLVVGENTDNYVTVLGDVKNPGIFYLKKNSATLLEILGNAGGVLDWSVNTSVELTRTDGRSEIIDTGENPAMLSGLIVSPKDVVYVIPSQKLKVYIFGSVNNPGVVKYHPGISLLEAVLVCGGSTGNAYLNEVLYFDGGLSSTPRVVDMSVVMQKKPSEDIKLKPGDVVYVPESAIVDITKVVGFLSEMLQFANNGVTLYNSINKMNTQVEN